MKTNQFYLFLAGLLLALLTTLPNATHAQVKVGSNYTTIGPTSNLEVEAATSGTATTGNKFMVNKTTGQVTIQDGTQGPGKVLTSDANGGSSWQSLATQRVPEVVWIGEQSSADYLITTFNSTFDVLKDRIPLVPRPGSLPGYDATTKKYTLQADGYYRFYIGAYMQGTLPAANAPNTSARLYLQPSGALQQFDNITNGSGPVLSLFWEGYFAAGTTVNPYVISFGSNQNVIVRKTFLSITKLF
ncbi:hypothetical protein [uncultured Fibrella sp.]|uniref:hypothetical protein n=1 Tax=uncultured Fibrella sp. TaxID=1284596 RepID=UPI0035CA1888